MRSVLFLAAMALLATPVTAAAPCRDSHGKFMKCATKAPAKAATKAKAAPAKAMAKAKQCRDAKGHFAKCK